MTVCTSSNIINKNKYKLGHHIFSLCCKEGRDGHAADEGHHRAALWRSDGAAREEERRQGSVVWECRFGCGALCRVSYNSLVTGNTTSCGCKKRSHKPPRLQYVEDTCIELLERSELRRDNTSGCTGVIATSRGMWKAEITFKKKRIFLGYYHDYEKAVQARKRAEEELFRPLVESYRGAASRESERALT